MWRLRVAGQIGRGVADACDALGQDGRVKGLPRAGHAQSRGRAIHGQRERAESKSSRIIGDLQAQRQRARGIPAGGVRRGRLPVAVDQASRCWLAESHPVA